MWGIPSDNGLPLLRNPIHDWSPSYSSSLGKSEANTGSGISGRPKIEKLLHIFSEMDCAMIKHL